MELTYHIHYRPKGQKGSQLSSLTPTNSAGGFASGPFVRGLWDGMRNSLYKSGAMKHPDTGQQLEFAALMFGGYPVRGVASGGQVCQRWVEGGPVEVLIEPEPDLYGPDAIRARLAAEREVPEQPPPPVVEAPADEPSAEDHTQLTIPDFDEEETKAAEIG